MPKITNLTNDFYYPDRKYDTLDELVIFPGTEIKRGYIPNSTVWLFDANMHRYKPEILHDDVGCGIAAFIIDPVNTSFAIEKITKYLAEKNILGRGNHFIDLCGRLDEDSTLGFERNHNVLVVHTDGKSYDGSIPRNVEEAQEKQKRAEEFRKDLGFNLSKLIKSSHCELIGNWTHNSVEESKGKIVYRKGTIKVKPAETHILPSNMCNPILFYTIDDNLRPPYDSMPHATGRVVSRSDGKVSLEKAKELRNLVYISNKISDNSLRTEHFSCYKDFTESEEILGKYILPVGKSEVLGYVGKI